MSRFKTIGNNLDLQFGQDLNDNFDKADQELNNQAADYQAKVNAVAATVSENELDIETKLQAHQQSTAAHEMKSIKYTGTQIVATDNAQQAVEKVNARVDTIITGGSATKDAEVVDIRTGADGVARASAGALTREIHAQQLASNIATAMLKHGLNVVSVNGATPLNLTIQGRTLVNLLGRDGNFETDSNGDGLADGWTKYTAGSCSLDTTNAKYGRAAQRITAVAGDSNASNRFIYRPTYFEQGKYYLVLVDLLTDGTTVGRMTLGSYVGVSSPTSKTLYAKLNPTASETINIALRNDATAGSVGWVQFDGADLYEVDASLYARVGLDITEANIRDYLPHVDSIQRIKNPIITKTGKNLLPPFTQWTLHANAVATEPYKLTLNATAADQASTVTISVLPNSKYVFSCDAGAVFTGSYLKSDQGWLSNINSGGPFTSGFVISTSSDVGFITLRTGNVGSGTYTFTNPQLELGSVPTAFEPQNNDYMMAQCTLAGANGVYDTLTVRGTEAIKTKRWVTDVVLDGSLAWVFNADYVGFKRVYMPFSTVIYNPTLMVVKFNGTVLPSTVGDDTLNNADRAYLSTSPNLVLSISDADTGFGEDYIPSAAEVAAYFNGWKMNNGTFRTPYNGTGTKTWTTWNATSNTGAVTAVPTTMAAGFTPYKLSYVLAKSVDEVVPVEGSIGLHTGGNQIDVGEGVVIKEKANPVLNSAQTYYYINYTSSYPASSLSQRNQKIIAVYKNRIKDNKWTINANGDGQQLALISKADYDPTAEYTATFILLDKYGQTVNVTDVTGEYNSSQKSIQDNIIKRLSDAETGLSINVNAIAEIYKLVKALGG